MGKFPSISTKIQQKQMKNFIILFLDLIIHQNIAQI